MKYVCLIYGDAETLQKTPKDEMAKVAAEFQEFTSALAKSGRLVAFHGMTGANTAATVRVREGKAMTTDGPFVETKELLGSILVIEAKDLNDAIQLAAKIPGARFGGVEVRPTWASQ